MPKKKKKRFFKKAKVKISTPQLVMLTAIIASLSILMLFFSILFPGKKTSVASKSAESVPNAVEKQVPSETVSSVAVENKTGRNQVMPENKGKPVPAKTVKPSESENTTIHHIKAYIAKNAVKVVLTGAYFGFFAIHKKTMPTGGTKIHISIKNHNLSQNLGFSST